MNEEASGSTRWPTVVTLFVALGAPPLFVLIPQRLFGPSPRLSVQLVLQLLYCGLVFAVLWVVRTQERLPLRSIALHRPDMTTLASGVLLAGVAFFALPLITAPLGKALNAEVQGTAQTLASLPLWFRLLLGVTGGIVEETLYRGYAIEQLARISGQVWLGATISVLAFTFAHIPAWGWRFALAADLPFGILMTIFFLWKRDLIANIIAHAIALVAGLLTI